MVVRTRGRSFQVDLTLNKVRHRASFKTIEAARQWEADLISCAPEGRVPPIPPKGVNSRRSMVTTGTIADALSRAKRRRWDYKRGSRGSVRCAELFVRWVGAKQSTEIALSEDVVHNFIHYLMNERKVSGATLNRYILQYRSS